MFKTSSVLGRCRRSVAIGIASAVVLTAAVGVTQVASADAAGKPKYGCVTYQDLENNNYAFYYKTNEDRTKRYCSDEMIVASERYYKMTRVGVAAPAALVRSSGASGGTGNGSASGSSSASGNSSSGSNSTTSGRTNGIKNGCRNEKHQVAGVPHYLETNSGPKVRCTPDQVRAAGGTQTMIDAATRAQGVGPVDGGDNDEGGSRLTTRHSASTIREINATARRVHARWERELPQYPREGSKPCIAGYEPMVGDRTVCDLVGLPEFQRGARQSTLEAIRAIENSPTPNPRAQA